MPNNNAIRCLTCDEIGVEMAGGTEPPDPDRHGNQRVGFKCERCGAQGTVVLIAHTGTAIESKSFEFADAHERAR